eukprot:365942-Chlamydomonas_euryale.AAC.66
MIVLSQHTLQPWSTHLNQSPVQVHADTIDAKDTQGFQPGTKSLRCTECRAASQVCSLFLHCQNFMQASQFPCMSRCCLAGL